MANIYFRRPNGQWKDGDTSFLDIIDSWKNEPAIDIIAHSNEGGNITIKSKKGRANIFPKKDGIGYYVSDADPFGYSSLPILHFPLMLENTAPQHICFFVC